MAEFVHQARGANQNDFQEPSGICPAGFSGFASVMTPIEGKLLPTGSKPGTISTTFLASEAGPFAIPRMAHVMR
jgi:hypothetical protein